MLDRRRFLQLSLGTATSFAALAGYAFGVEPLLRLSIVHHRLRPTGWPAGLALKIAVIADLHACEPWMDAARINLIVQSANALDPDLTVLLGDYVPAHRYITGVVPARRWAHSLGRLRAPLGVHAVLGNHDWWDDRVAQRRGKGPVLARRELEQAGIPVYENDAVRLQHGPHGFWLGGLGDQIALRRSWHAPSGFRGVDDLPGTLAQVLDDAPIILLAHEPDIFPQVPERVALTICGHTHGGQVRLLGYSPVVPSSYGNRYAYGHVVEENRHLVVSGGLGCSIMPVRFGVPPEITVIEIAA
jgi:predicted MPP superfamily phosphohydrolase